MPPGEERLFALVLIALAVCGCVILFRWLASGPRKPDPWDEAGAYEMDMAESVPVCHRCFTEHSEHAHFCSHCGAAVGGFNNVMPYEYLFSQGEVLRNGTTDHLPRNFRVIAGYLLLSVSAYTIFAPIYWFFFFRNIFRSPDATTPAEIHG